MIAKSKKPNPYPGPRPFEPEESGIFFGREREVRELLSLIIAHRAVLLYAQSGAGKTSLLNAGVIPLLTKESFEVLPVARVRGFEPEDINLKEIPNIYVFNTLVGWAGDNVEPRSLVSTSIGTFLKELELSTDKQGLSLPRVAIFDQFEELFTSYPSRWEEREGFFRQVAEALEADPLLRVLFVIREDYLASLDSYLHMLPERLRTRYRLERLRAEAACQAVEGPLRDTGRKFAEGVASRLVHKLLNIRVENAAGEIVEVPGEYVEPVQLQVVCQSLWLNLPRDVTDITSDHIEEFGDVQEALRRFYEKAIKTAKRETGVRVSKLRNWFNEKLITPAGTRGTVFRGKEQTGGIANSAVDVLEAQHIIRAEIRAGARWYELTHDRLIEPIRKSYANKQTGSLKLFRRLTKAIVVMVVISVVVIYALPRIPATLLLPIIKRANWNLTVKKAAGGFVRIDPNNVRYKHGEMVILTAVAYPNYMFYNWSGDLSDGNNPTTLVMDADKTVTANFVKTYSLEVPSVIGGSVTKNPNKVRYKHGEMVDLEAIPNTGYSFTYWSGDLYSNNKFDTLLMDADKTVTANFVALDSGDLNRHSLTVTVADGYVTKDPNKPRYYRGEMVTLEAVADPNYVFYRWSGDLSGSNNPTTLAMDADKWVTANFALKTYSLTTTAVNGSVTIDPAKANYYHGETVTLKAVPDPNYMFDGWSGDLSGTTNPTKLVMDKNKSVTANFSHKTYSLAVPSVIGGSVTKNPDKARYKNGEKVTLEAVATVGYRFTNWSGDLSGSTNPTTLVMDADKTVTANFVTLDNGDLNRHSLTVTVADGYVTKNPDKARYKNGDKVTLEAVAEPNYVFDDWSGDLSGRTNPITLFMDADKSVTANFVKTYSLAVPSVAGGSVRIVPDKVRYKHGEKVTLEAVADPNYMFYNWSGDLSDGNNPTTLVMDADKTVTANFVKTYSLVVSSVAGGSVRIVPDKARYKNGEKVTLEAVADPNYVFYRWSGDLSDGNNPVTLVMDSDKTVTASFAWINSIGMKLVYIPAGSFIMGSPSDEKGRIRDDEGPQHEVIISEGFWMGQTEVTQGQYESIMNSQPWSGYDNIQESDSNPAVCVTWDEAAEFCRRLGRRQQEGKTYRLPTEAEWEYVCRAGTTSRFSFGNSESSLGDYAWFSDNARKAGQEYAHPVGKKKPNPWGLYDMHGNVWEWCSDWKDYYSNSPSVDPQGPSNGKYRCLRGGSWFNSESYLRCADRNGYKPSVRFNRVGFRVVCEQ